MPVGSDALQPGPETVVEGPLGVDRQVNGEVQDVYTDEQIVAAVRDEAEKQATSPLGLENAIKKAHERGINLRDIAENAGWSQDAVRKLTAKRDSAA